MNTSRSQEKGDALYRYLVSYKLAHGGNSPSFRQISAALGLSSTSYVAYLLDGLERRGLIQRERHQPCAITIIEHQGGPR